MSRVCDLTGKSVMSGNNVSHAMNLSLIHISEPTRP